MSTRRGFPEPPPPEKDMRSLPDSSVGKVPTPTGKIKTLK